MNTFDSSRDFGCGCDGGCSRREFIAGVAFAGSAGLTGLSNVTAFAGSVSPRKRKGARIRAVFLYPPSRQFADAPDGWWSWPGNQFDAEGRQAQYTTALQEMAKRLDMQIDIDPHPVATADDAKKVAGQMQADKPDGLLIIMLYNNSLALADVLLEAAKESSIPAIFYIGLGVKHGPIVQYRRAGVYLIQSLDNMDAIEAGLRMVNAKKLMSQSTLLSIVEAEEPSEGVEEFLGITVRVIPFARYAEAFHRVAIDAYARKLIAGFKDKAREVREVTQEALENAARAHFAIKELLAKEQADGLTMRCLQRGMLKPCMSFATLNGELIPAACENDLSAVYTQMLGQLLTGRPGFQHNPAFETERNHYYASHCTCSTRAYGPDGPELPYILRRFAHSNEGSCAIQVFWKADDPVTIAHYYPGKEPALDVYAGKVIASHPMPPAGGCTTNIEIEITDRPDACMVKGHHNLVFCGDFARRFRLFAQLYNLRLADTGFAGPWPV